MLFRSTGSGGNVFSGWCLGATSCGTPLMPGASTPTLTNNVTAYAQWATSKFTLTYDGNTNDGGSVPSSQIGSGGITLRANDNLLTKSGYTFGGWNTASNGAGTNYTAGTGTFSLAADTTLYAKWSANTYSVTYNGNSNTGGTIPSNGTATYNSTFTVASNTG